jgi:hypothetical protein
MKTTVEIRDDLLRAAREQARRDGTTLRALVEGGLRTVLKERQAARRKFKLKHIVFKGDGLQSGIREGDWKRIMEIFYEGRGA